MNPRVYPEMSLADLLGAAALFVENYIDDHREDAYEGENDEMLRRDISLAEQLREAEHNAAIDALVQCEEANA